MPNTARLNKAIVTLAGILQRKRDAGDDRILLAQEHLDLLKELPQQIRQQLHPPTPTSPGHPLGGNKREQLNRLAKMVIADQNCRALGTLRDTMVFASGNPDARLMLVGEAPGAEEERERRPFIGPAGQLLDKILKAMGLGRDEVYLSNIVKFRPQVGNTSAPNAGNRKPSGEEIASCLKYIMAEIDVVQPDVIIALGGTAANALLDDSSPVGKLRQKPHSLKGIPLVVTYHPAYLLRCESNSPGKLKAEKSKVWQDMKLAMAKLEDPSS